MSFSEELKKGVEELIPEAWGLTEAQVARAIRKTGRAVKIYCNRDDLPLELLDVLIDMVYDLLKLDYGAANPATTLVAKAIKEGDASVEFGSAGVSASEAATNSIVMNYKGHLNRFRKVRW